MKKKIFILISFLSASEISYFSWKTISKDNRRQIVRQKKKDDRHEKEENSQEIIQNNLQENKSSLVWIIFGIVILVVVALGTIYFFKKKNVNNNKKEVKPIDPFFDKNIRKKITPEIKNNLSNNFPNNHDSKEDPNKEKTDPDNPKDPNEDESNILNNFQKDNETKPQDNNNDGPKINDENQNKDKPNILNNSQDNSKPQSNNDHKLEENKPKQDNKPNPNEGQDNQLKDENTDDHQSKVRKCIAQVSEDGINFFLGQTWNPEEFIKRIFYRDIESKLNIEDQNLKKMYNKLNQQKNKEKIINFLNSCCRLLQYVNDSFFNKINDDRKIGILVKNNCNSFTRMLYAYKKAKNKENLEDQIFLETNVIDTGKYYKVAEEPLLLNYFQNKNYFQLFKQINYLDPLVYYYKKNPNDKNYTTDFLFGYSHAFYYAILGIKLDFTTLLENCNHEYEFIDENDVDPIKKNIEEINVFFKFNELDDDEQEEDDK